MKLEFLKEFELKFYSTDLGVQFLSPLTARRDFDSTSARDGHSVDANPYFCLCIGMTG